MPCKIEVNVEIDSACKNFLRAFFCTAFMIGVLAFFYEIMHEHNRYPVCAVVIRTETSKVVQRVHLPIYFCADPLDAGFCKRDKIESRL